MSKQKSNHKWIRVRSENASPQELRRRHRNKATFEDDVFKRACALAGILPTHRQASKWSNKRGLALRFRQGAANAQND